MQTEGEVAPDNLYKMTVQLIKVWLSLLLLFLCTDQAVTLACFLFLTRWTGLVCMVKSNVIDSILRKGVSQAFSFCF